jgi:hypothetical protein
LKQNLNSNLNCKLRKIENKRNSNCSGLVSLKETGPTTRTGSAHKGVWPRAVQPGPLPECPVRPTVTKVRRWGVKGGGLSGVVGFSLSAHHLTPPQLPSLIHSLRCSPTPLVPPSLELVLPLLLLLLVSSSSAKPYPLLHFPWRRS